MKERIFNILERTHSITYWDKSLNRFVAGKIDDSCEPYVELSKLEDAYKLLEDEIKFSVPKVIYNCKDGDVKIIYPISNNLKSYLQASIAAEKLMAEQDEEDRKYVHDYLIRSYQTMLNMIEEQERELEKY